MLPCKKKHDNIYQVKQVRTCRRCKIWGVQASPLVPFKVLAFCSWEEGMNQRESTNKHLKQSGRHRSGNSTKGKLSKGICDHLCNINHQTHLGLPRICNVVSVAAGAAALSSPNWILSIIFCVSWKYLETSHFSKHAVEQRMSINFWMLSTCNFWLSTATILFIHQSLITSPTPSHDGPCLVSRLCNQGLRWLDNLWFFTACTFLVRQATASHKGLHQYSLSKLSLESSTQHVIASWHDPYPFILKGPRHLHQSLPFRFIFAYLWVWWLHSPGSLGTKSRNFNKIHTIPVRSCQYCIVISIEHFGLSLALIFCSKYFWHGFWHCTWTHTGLLLLPQNRHAAKCCDAATWEARWGPDTPWRLAA